MKEAVRKKPFARCPGALNVPKTNRDGCRPAFVSVSFVRRNIP